MRVFLVRHGQSNANIDWSQNTKHADMCIKLTDEGKEQATAAGKFLKGYFEQSLMQQSADGRFMTVPKVRLWHSPYDRTRQTAQGISDACRVPEELTIGSPLLLNPAGPKDDRRRNRGDSFFVDPADKEQPVMHAREHFLLYEQAHGMFDGLSDEDRGRAFPEAWAYYQKHKRDGGKVFAQMLMGESRIDVAARMQQAFGTFHRDREENDIKNIVVVGHGTTNRCFVFAWFKKRYEWLEKEPNPKNCSVRLIEDGVDKGYIFDGFDHPDGFIHDHQGADDEAG
jgi:2,3-bisphosphoglycerate-dependent phosphoglycerate mutase